MLKQLVVGCTVAWSTVPRARCCLAEGDWQGDAVAIQIKIKIKIKIVWSYGLVVFFVSVSVLVLHLKIASFLRQTEIEIEEI